MNKALTRIIAITVAAITMVSGCECKHHGPDNGISYNKVMILYSAGYNSLSSYLREDIEDMKTGYLPAKNDGNALLVVSHLSKTNSDFTTPSSPVILRMYKDKKKGARVDTVATYPYDKKLSEASDLNDILSTIQKQYPARHYGMVFSSHSTGWVPKGYYGDPGRYDSKPFGAKSQSAGLSRILPEGAVPYVEPEEIPGAPAVKSFGMTNARTETQTISYEMDLPEFVSSIPMHLDYLILDACLAGGIEVAYQMRNTCDVICFSQAEVLAEGLDYTTLASHLLEHDSDVVSVADDYYQQYMAKTDLNERAATMSVIDCARLDDVAACCKLLFKKYKDNIAALNPRKVQQFFRYSKHWYYDLEDVLVKAGMDSEEKRLLESAIDGSILYKAATESFLKNFEGFDINTYSGFSMYLPCNGSNYLNSFYKTLDWNKATELVD